MGQPRRGLQFLDTAAGAAVSRISGTSEHLPEDPVEPLGGQDTVLLEPVDPELPDGSSQTNDLRIDPDFFKDLERNQTAN